MHKVKRNPLVVTPTCRILGLFGVISTLLATVQAYLNNQVSTPITRRILDLCKWECCVSGIERKHKVCPALENAPETLKDDNISLFVDIYLTC